MTVEKPVNSISTYIFVFDHTCSICPGTLTQCHCLVSDAEGAKEEKAEDDASEDKPEDDRGEGKFEYVTSNQRGSSQVRYCCRTLSPNAVLTGSIGQYSPQFCLCWEAFLEEAGLGAAN